MKLREDWPQFSDDEVTAVERVLRSGRVNYWTGDEGRRFEEEFAQAVGAKAAVAMANGSVTLEACLRALKLRPGDEVVVTPRSFVASASCVPLCGGVPVFADVDWNSGNLTAETIERVLSPKTKGVVLVHLAGWPCEMDEILSLADDRGLWIVEDCAQAHGARYRGRSVGAFGAASSWSFCQDKILTTAGEGGMVTTNDEDLAEACWSLKDHGKNRRKVADGVSAGTFRWLHDSMGTNWRMTEVQAAVGREQLKRLEEWVGARAERAAAIDEVFASTSALRVPNSPSHSRHAYYKHYAYIDEQALKSGWNRDRVLAVSREAGATCFSGSCGEIYLEKAFTHAGFGPGERLPIARKLAETSIMLQVHPTLQVESARRNALMIADIVRSATH